MLDIGIQLIASFIAAAGFGIIFNAPRQLLIACGFVGMLGWIVYYTLAANGMDVLPATVLGAMVVAAFSHFFSRFKKSPIIIFNVSGIIPLVPGGIAYDAMRNFVVGNYLIGIELSSKVMMLASGIAIGLIFTEVLHTIVKKMMPTRHRQA
nr:threonine/serine exporter family protein [Ornithinibacillus gellani]